MSSEPIPVLIAGAGPTGLYLALSLLRNGIPVRIIDKEPQFHLGSRGSGVQPRTLEIAHFLGILPELKRLGNPIPLMRLYKLPGGVEPLKTWKGIEPFVQSPAFPQTEPLQLSQARHEGVLRAELEKYNCRVELGTELVSFTQDDEGVTAQLAIHGDEGKNRLESVRALFLAGADGAKGGVRKNLGLTFKGETQDAQGLVVCDAIVRGLDHDHWHSWVNKEGLSFWIRSLDPTIDLYNIVMLVTNNSIDLDTQKLREPSALTNLFHQHVGRTDIVIGEPSWMSYFRPNMRMVDKFSLGRVFVLGDGAHVHSPTGGQGLNSSVQDSFNLAWKLALVNKGLAPLSLLDTFNEERLPVIEKMLEETTGLYKKEIATTAKGAGSTGEFYRGKELFMLGINYRWSSLVLDTRTEDKRDDDWMKAHAYGGYGDSVCAGDRAPDATELVDLETRAKTTVFDIFDVAKHTVLLFVGSQAQSDTVEGVVHAVSAYPSGTIQVVAILGDGVECDVKADRVLVDSAHHAFNSYDVKDVGVTIVVVRPDTFVGAVVSTSATMDTYFSNIFGRNDVTN